MNRQERISQFLTTLTPSYCQVDNESYMHNVPKGSETHFKIVIASEKFQGQALVQRHRSIQHLLADELKSGLQALALHTYTPGEWERKTGGMDSPKCLGGEKKHAG